MLRRMSHLRPRRRALHPRAALGLHLSVEKPRRLACRCRRHARGLEVRERVPSPCASSCRARR